jgi:DNA polymerase-3 subunit gamma/tau
LTADSANRDSITKLADRVLKNAFKLEAEGISETIPIGQLRRASYWCHLAPAGRGKLLLIENADRMQDEARNSLLKLLEEPPARVTLVLTSARPGSLLPTILSRLRPYRFAARSAEAETGVIKRVFRDADAVPANSGNLIGAYLESFLPVSGETLEALAAFFAASVAYKAAFLAKRQGRALPEEVVLLGKYTAPRAEAAGLGRPQSESSAVVPVIVAKAGKFEIRSLFSRFIFLLLEQVSLSRKEAPPDFLPALAYNELWKKCSAWVESAVLTYKLQAAPALEKFFTDLSRGMAGL